MCSATFEQSEKPRFLFFGEALLRYTPASTEEGASSCPKKDVEVWQQAVAGSEFNVAVALSHLGWSEHEFITVVPTGSLGEHLKLLIEQALGNKVLLTMQRPPGGEVGIVHIWPDTGKRVYQREHSAFSNLDPVHFNEDFWTKLFASRSRKSHPEVLHTSGVPPLISAVTSKVWASALTAARIARTSGRQLVTTLELLPRRELGGFLELWMAIIPHLKGLDILVLATEVLGPLCTLLGVSRGASVLPRLDALRRALSGVDVIKQRALPEELATKESVDAVYAEALKEFQRMLPADGPTLLVVAKLEEAKRPAAAALPKQIRWSLACFRGGDVVSTLPHAVHHSPQCSEGGTDAWLAGVLDGLLCQDAEIEAKLTKSEAGPLPFRLEAGTDKWMAALRRGDLLASLKQGRTQLSSDLCTVTRAELESSNARS